MNYRFTKNVLWWTTTTASFLSVAFAFSRLTLPPHLRTTWQNNNEAVLFSAVQTKTVSPQSWSRASISDDCFKIAVCGGGPSGLLMAHAILNKLNTTKCKVDVFERSPKPGSSRFRDSYALGLGIRGRSAITKISGDETWKAVSRYGYPCGKFVLHMGPIPIQLRTAVGPDNQSENHHKEHGGDSGGGGASLLIFQSDICRALVEDLDSKWGDSGRINLHFDTTVSQLDLETNTVTTSSYIGQDASSSSSSSSSYDLVIGCDGVDSIARKTMHQAWPAFETSVEPQKRFFKVVRLPTMPPVLDPTAVHMLFPKTVKNIAPRTSIKAFIVPTVNQSCSLLFLSEKEKDDLLFTATPDTFEASTLVDLLEARYPKLVGADLKLVAERLMEARVRQPSRVQCNTYHYQDKAVLLGDAAHGGVEQGLNAALSECVVLADCLAKHCNPKQRQESLHQALLSYSQQAVPQGKALDDLSFGPQSVLGKMRWMGKTLRDVIFQGNFGLGEKLSLHSKLTTSLEPFAEIRQGLDRYFEADFPDEAYWQESLSKLHIDSLQASCRTVAQ